MEALYDRNGKVHAWLHESGKIYGLRGENLAFVDGKSVYDWTGRHIGWWQDGHIRDSANAAFLFTSKSTNMGVVKPFRAVRPVQPVRSISPVKPVKSIRPVKPVKALSWSRRPPF